MTRDPRLHPQAGDALRERAAIRTTDVEAVHELWRAWLVAAVTPAAVCEPPQMFRVIDGRWCLHLRPHDAAPRWLGIDATPEQAEIHEAFRLLHSAINHAKTPILLVLGDVGE